MILIPEPLVSVDILFLSDKNEQQKISASGYVFSNQNECKVENDLYFLPIYLIMFI